MLDDPPDEVLARARASGVDWVVCPGVDAASARAARTIAEAHPGSVSWTAGLHPHDAERWGDEAEAIAELADAASAIGECGLDFHYDFSPRDQQQRAMREQWEVAIDAGLPVIVHNRESDEAMLEVFRPFTALRAVFHSFCAGADMARELLEREGIWLGISGMVTFRAADNVREVFELTTAERLLVEPACAAGLAAVAGAHPELQAALEETGQEPVVVVVCGGNMVSLADFA